MSRKTLQVVLLVLSAALVLVATFFATFEHKDVTVPVAATGAARYNRFLALEKTLQRMDVPVVALATLDPEKLPLAPGDTLVFGGDVAQVDVDDAKRIAAWVSDGGHLVLSPGPVAVHTPLFEALGLIVAGSGDDTCSAIRTSEAKTDKDELRLCGDPFKLAPAAVEAVDASIGNAQDGYLFARTRVDDGTASLIANLNMLSRTRLKHAAAQRFARRLLAPNLDTGTVYLVYALDGPSFLKLLLLKGWPALLSLGLLLAAWMAMRSARLGPLMPAPVLHRRALLEHVQAAGEFLYRRDGGRSLHGLACQTVLARLRRRDPACVMLNGEALYERLAQRGGPDAAQIAQAFQSPANAQAFRASIITLARLRSRP